MISKIKKISRLIFKIFLGVFVLLFMLNLMLTLIMPNWIINTKTVNILAVSGLILSMPGIVAQLVQEVNPKKSKYKIKAQCPHCHNSIEMEMVEE